MQPVLMLLTAPPQSRMAYHALRLAQSMQQQELMFDVFFYQDAVTIANQQLWYAEDQLNLTQQWQQLNIPLHVCVSAALSRGVSDLDNANRHQLEHSNLATGFQLVGLGTLADAIHTASHVIQF